MAILAAYRLHNSMTASIRLHLSWPTKPNRNAHTQLQCLHSGSLTSCGDGAPTPKRYAAVIN
ncbi:MAG TPA: hypothetical protein DEF45_00500 [Rhodopirellula sp.]|nr:MAG: hypothetical protein CBD74_00920 [Saprospirales bacterium TMED214]HBV61478.1 hypothetical protein [Rhodopirellula sp.]